jgi:hypothetical protein
MPLYALTVLHMTVYLFDARQLEARSAITATYFLAGFALLFVTGEVLPTTDFLTKLDQAIVCTSVMMATTGVCTAVLYIYVKVHDKTSQFVQVEELRDGLYWNSELGYFHEWTAQDEFAARANLFLAYALTLFFVVSNLLIFVPAVIQYHKDVRTLKKDSAPENDDSTAKISNPLTTNDVETFKGKEYSGKKATVKKGSTYFTLKTLEELQANDPDAGGS